MNTMSEKEILIFKITMNDSPQKKKLTIILICLVSVSNRGNEPFSPNRKDVMQLMHTILIFRYVFFFLREFFRYVLLLKFKYMLDVYKYNNVSFSHVSYTCVKKKCHASCFGFHHTSKVRNDDFQSLTSTIVITMILVHFRAFSQFFYGFISSSIDSQVTLRI